MYIHVTNPMLCLCDANVHTCISVSLYLCVNCVVCKCTVHSTYTCAEWLELKKDRFINDNLIQNLSFYPCLNHCEIWVLFHAVLECFCDVPN